jgi:hypothetical protein
MDLNAWFHWLFPSPGYFLLAVAGLLVLLGLIGGLTDSRVSLETDPLPPDEEDGSSIRPWWKRDEERRDREWNDQQARERRRSVQD